MTEQHKKILFIVFGGVGIAAMYSYETKGFVYNFFNHSSNSNGTNTIPTKQQSIEPTLAPEAIPQTTFPGPGDAASAPSDPDDLSYDESDNSGDDDNYIEPETQTTGDDENTGIVEQATPVTTLQPKPLPVQVKIPAPVKFTPAKFATDAPEASRSEFVQY